MSAEAARRGRAPFVVTMCALGALLVLVAVGALCVGRYAVSVPDVLRVLANKVGLANFDVDARCTSTVAVLRLPRIVAAMFVGAALALAGSTYQGLFQNPLVSPDLLGVSSGACVGASAAILLGLGAGGVQGLAFAGGIVAVVLTMALPRLMRSSGMMSLVLAGVVTSGFMSSIVGLLKYAADTETELPEIVYWQMGSLAKVDFSDLAAVLPVMVVTGAGLVLMSWRIDLLSLGDRESESLGVRVGRERGVAIALSTLLTACAVCLAGTIGWIGLIVPHMARRLVGSSNTRVLPASALIAAIFLLAVDTLARTLTGSEIPLGILTGIVGAPFFAFILVRNRRAGR